MDRYMSIVIMSSYSKSLMLWQSGNPSRAWNPILRNAVSWVYKDPDPLQTPLPQANRTHHEYWRCNKVPGCRLPGYRFLEDTHRKNLQAQQHAQDLKTQPQVLWWGLKSNTYFRIVRLNSEYCSFVWTQHKKCQIWKLEINQRTAA